VNAETPHSALTTRRASWARSILDLIECTPATFAPARDPPQAEFWFDAS
jgi:hypothetical protein